MSEPFLRTSDDADAIWFFGTLALVKAGGDQTGDLSVVEQTGRRGVATPLHVQDEDQETFYVLEGELTFFGQDGTVAGSTSRPRGTSGSSGPPASRLRRVSCRRTSRRTWTRS